MDKDYWACIIKGCSDPIPAGGDTDPNLNDM